MEVHCSSDMEENKQHIWKKMSTAKQYKDGRLPGKETPEKRGSQGRRRELRRSASLPVRVASAAREQRARLYIMRRCVSMLVSSCWKNYP
ncbi:hypothetical protein CFC21_052577 [Triticum aestivum]|uniref:Uncharacterized protein n=4 Tax=Triticum TaxID=4564 RepID=A0A9R0SGA2_TRITD|nr:uncharacterized protein LOC119288952 [Triticum dicoccoides]KAF7043172.1 hypothetical protein CFC21_052577 [Triticum aestivum]VAH92389.1 unnamed protein product [Triticum turgidum subsp. durum]